MTTEFELVNVKTPRDLTKWDYIRPEQDVISRVTTRFMVGDLFYVRCANAMEAGPFYEHSSINVYGKIKQ